MDECPVCLECLDEELGYVTECCKQKFHEECFIKCIEFNGKCPTCRRMHLVQVEVTQTMSYYDRMVVVRWYLVIFMFIGIMGATVFAFVTKK